MFKARLMICCLRVAKDSVPFICVMKKQLYPSSLSIPLALLLLLYASYFPTSTNSFLSPIIHHQQRQLWQKHQQQDYSIQSIFLSSLLYDSCVKDLSCSTRLNLSDNSDDPYTNEMNNEEKNNIEDKEEEPTSLNIDNEKQQQKQQQENGAEKKNKKKIVIIGAGWGGLSAAYQLICKQPDDVDVTVIDAASRVGGLVRDGYMTVTGQRPAEAGQHGFWNNYYNIYRLLKQDLSTNNKETNFDIKSALTDYAEQGQYSPTGIQAIWPVYKDRIPQLPTGLAQAFYTKFFNLPWYDLISALPLVIAFSEFDDSPEAWEKYDSISFYDLCLQLGVSKRCYDEAFEPMILTGLFAPGTQCSAAAALGMAYFFVLQSQNSFDVQWCRGNIGNVILDPWIDLMKKRGVHFQCDTKVTGFEIDSQYSEANNPKDNIKPKIVAIRCLNTKNDANEETVEVDDVIFAVGAKALSSFVRFCPELAKFSEFRNFANLRGTSVLATRLFLDKNISLDYSANACWGFDKGIGMTMFDITTIHGRNASTVEGSPGSVIEVDYYHANKLLCMSDDTIMAKVKSDLDTILGHRCRIAKVSDAAIVRLPEAVNWYFPGSYSDMPDLQSKCMSNVYFAGDIVRTRHGSWSQEKAFVTGMQAANLLLGRQTNEDVIPLPDDELHVQLGRELITKFKQMLLCAGLDAGNQNSVRRAPFIVDFFRW